MVDESAAITLNERNLIEEPLARIMDRLSPEMTEKIQTFSDPVLLLFGLGLYGMRLYKIAQAKAESTAAHPVETPAAPTTAPEKMEPTPRDNGNLETRPLKPADLVYQTSGI